MRKKHTQMHDTIIIVVNFIVFVVIVVVFVVVVVVIMDNLNPKWISL